MKISSYVANVQQANYSKHIASKYTHYSTSQCHKSLNDLLKVSICIKLI